MANLMLNDLYKLHNGVSNHCFVKKHNESCIYMIFFCIFQKKPSQYFKFNVLFKNGRMVFPQSCVGHRQSRVDCGLRLISMIPFMVTIDEI